MTDDFRPGQCHAPAVILREWMEELRISVPALAMLGAGRDRQDEAAGLIQAILDLKPLDAECAQILAWGTGISAGFWTGLEAEYREALAEGRADVTEEDGSDT
jgi:hypothetical protein